MEKETFWTRPYPESILNLVRPLWKNDERKPRSERGVRRLLLLFAAAALILIVLVNGLSDPMGYFVDIPSFSLGDMVDAYPEYAAYYFVGSMAVTAVLMALVNALLRSKEDISPWTLNGVLLWIVSIAVGILADGIVRQILLEKWVIPVYENRNASYEAAWQFAFLLIALVVSWYFVLDDFMGNALSITLAPYVMYALEGLVPGEILFGSTLALYLVLTALLKVVLYVLARIGVDRWIVGVFKKYLYTPKYMGYTYLCIFLLPVLPLILIWKLLRGKK